MNLIDEVETARPRLLALAHRMLGSFDDAEDVVQTVWVRAQRVAPEQVERPEAWLTTVTARLCIDQLRSRERRGELPLFADALPAPQVAADEEYLRREDVSRALLVLLGRLTASQRVAYVLHDLFRVPFDDIAAVLDTTPTNAKKLASRARGRLDQATTPPAMTPAQSSEHWRIVEAFLAAARGGRLDTLVTLMAPGVVRTADPNLLPEGAAVELAGRRAVADETRQFAERVRASIPMLVNGSPAAVIAPGGHPLAVISFAFEGGAITRITIARIHSTDVIAVRPHRG